MARIPRLLASGSTVLNAIGSVLPQIVSLVVLQPADFGLFSILYLMYAFSVSLSLSLISEPWIRTAGSGPENSVGYGTAAAYLGALTWVAVFVVALTMDAPPSVSIFLATAAAFSMFRSCARYRQVFLGRWGIVALADSANIVGFVIGFVVALFLNLDLLLIVSASWAIGSVLSVCIAPGPVALSPRWLSSWVRRYGVEIRSLLGDSLLMDMGSIFAPLLLIPRLGVGGFGIYRAVSNVAAPVRLVLNPLRAVIGRSASGRPLDKKSTIQIVLVGVATGGGASSVLILLQATGWDVGSLSPLSIFWAPVGLFVGMNFVGHFFYIRCRAGSSHRVLMRARYIQTGLMVALPLLGAYAGGLSGAIWMLGAASTASALSWLLSSRATPVV